MLRLEAFSRVLEIIKEVVDLLLVDLQIRAIDLQLQMAYLVLPFILTPCIFNLGE